MLNTRILTAADLSTVLRLKEQAGWNQLPADIVRFLDLEPGGCFLAESDGAPVGTACGFLFGRVAWIAMVLVDQAYRGRGIGRLLMNTVLEYVDRQGATTVRLDATALGRPLYETLGFATQFTLLRYHAKLPERGAESLPSEDAETTSLPPELLEEVIELDRRVTHTERSKLIRRLYAESPDAFRVTLRNGHVDGYLTSRPGSRARQIGPAIADQQSGVPLLAAAVAGAAGEDVFIDVPATHAAANDWLLARGFAPQRELIRMCRGAPVLEEIGQVWASSGPEKG